MACTLQYNKHRQKTKPVRTTTKNRVWPLQKIGKFCNYQNFKDAYSFLSSDKILCSLWQLSFLGSSYFANVTNQRYWLHKKFCLSHLRAGFQNSRKNHCCRP